MNNITVFGLGILAGVVVDSVTWLIAYKNHRRRERKRKFEERKNDPFTRELRAEAAERLGDYYAFTAEKYDRTPYSSVRRNCNFTPSPDYGRPPTPLGPRRYKPTYIPPLTPPRGPRPRLLHTSPPTWGVTGLWTCTGLGHTGCASDIQTAYTTWLRAWKREQWNNAVSRGKA